MKPIAVVLIALVAGSVPALATRMLASPPEPAESRSEVAEPPRVAALESTLQKMDERQARLEETLETLRAQISTPVEAAPRIPVGAIDAAIERAVAERMGELIDSPDVATAGMPLKAPSEQVSIDEMFAALVADDFSTSIEREEYWQMIRDAGMMDAVIARFEERAATYPDDPEIQVDLGEVYIQKVMEVGNGPMAGKWATKADDAFDAALALDDRHWGARFNKAASLSFWPAVFGKQPEAIQQFEILTEQQESLPSDSRHAQTYLLLGNLYQQNGKPEKAIEAWERGLERFPDDASLIGQLEIAN